MRIEQIYTGCLSQGAYYIESNGEAVVIDPLREVEPYLEKAAADNATIRFVLETHFHADFVSGHVDLSKKTGAPIVFGPGATPAFDHYSAKDGEVLTFGKVSITVLHTPGHTMESACYLLKNEKGHAVALFSGDTLFIGDVGRPDLAQQVSADLSSEKLAAYLYDSLRNKIMPLPDDIMVYPAHGAGSACGKNMSLETSDTLGHQKLTNYALNPALSREEFTREVTSGLGKPPAYFPLNVRMNSNGYESMETVLKRGLTPLDPTSFENAANETRALILDVRSPQQFASGFIPNSINIGINGSFAPWVGSLIPDIRQEILLVTEPGSEEEVITRLGRVGYDHVVGYLHGGFQAWKEADKEYDTVQQVTAEQFAAIIESDPGTPVIDVRRNTEYQSEHMTGSKNLPLDLINQYMTMLDHENNVYVHCAGGYRSMIFISIMRARGFKNLVDIAGGFKAMREQPQINLTDFICPTTLS